MEHLTRAYFVYGTLRPGMGNHGIWGRHHATAVYDGEIKVMGAALIVPAHYGIPYAVPVDDPTSYVVGCLIIPPADDRQQRALRTSLDWLEGHPNHYERVAVTARSPHASVRCWIYTPTQWQPTGRVIASGDYARQA